MQNSTPTTSALPVSKAITSTPVLEKNASPTSTVDNHDISLFTPESDDTSVFKPERGNFTISTYKVAQDGLHARMAKNEEEKSLEVSIRFLKIEPLDKPWRQFLLSVFVEFKNISDHSIIFKTPRRISFVPLWQQNMNPLGDSARGDFLVGVKRKDGQPIMFQSTSELLAKEYYTGMISSDFENFRYHRPENFRVIAPDKAASYIYTFHIPIIFLEKNTLTRVPNSYKTAPGTYILSGEYGNFAVGYQYPVQEESAITPTSPNPHAAVADINAWVGIIGSNDIEFTIP